MPICNFLRRLRTSWAIQRACVGASKTNEHESETSLRVDEVGFPKVLLKYMPVVREKAELFGLDPLLIAATIMTESSGDPWATKYEPGWEWFFPEDQMIAYSQKAGTDKATEYIHQATSWGLTQVMGTVAREHGYLGPMPRLCEPELNIHYGALHLKKFSRKYSTIEEVISAYNAGSVVRVASGMFKNQVHVDRAMRFYREMQKA